MAIAPAAGGTAFLASTGTSISSSAHAVSTGWEITVVVAIANTSASVLTMTDTAGNTYLLQSAVTGSSVRTETWACASATANASNIIAVALSALSLASLAWEGYSGAVSTVIGNTATNSGSSIEASASVVLQDSGNWAVVGVGFACLSGDTFSAIEGTIRQFVVPSLTTVGVAIVDNTINSAGTFPTGALLSTARSWAAAGIELRFHGGSQATFVDYSQPAGFDFSLMTIISNQTIQWNEPLREASSSGGGNVAY